MVASIKDTISELRKEMDDVKKSQEFFAEKYEKTKKDCKEAHENSVQLVDGKISAIHQDMDYLHNK